jgi:methionine synthase II (cobalamin-independent)
MFETTIAGSLPKPAWLAKPRMLWAPWQLAGEALAEAKRDATLLALKEQEDAGIDIVTDGEQSRQHFVHGFLEHIEGVDFARPGRDGHPQQPLSGRSADRHRTATAQRDRSRRRGRHCSRAHNAAAEIHPARADDDRRHDRRRPLRRQG